MQEITLSNGCRIAYTERGTGSQTYVLIHGLGTHASSWEKNIGTLSKHARCIALDLPGNGLSGDAPDKRYSISFFAKCVIDFIGRLSLRNVTLGGHSMGGQIAITAALEEPRCAQRLLLVAPAGFETFSLFEQQAARLSFHAFDFLRPPEIGLRDALEASFFRMPEDAKHLVEEGIALLRARPLPAYRAMIDACIAGMMGEPVFAKLDRISHPTLVLFGEYDALIPNRLLHPTDTPRTIGERGIRRMKAATLRVIPRAGHFVHWEAAGAVNRIVESWQAGVPVSH